MDDGALFLFVLLVLGLGTLTATGALAKLRHLGWRWVLGCAGILAIHMVLAGLLIYQVYWLNERLVAAADNGDAREVRALLRWGADPNATWEDGASALDRAKASGCKECVKLLEDAGARWTRPRDVGGTRRWPSSSPA